MHARHVRGQRAENAGSRIPGAIDAVPQYPESGAWDSSSLAPWWREPLSVASASGSWSKACRENLRPRITQFSEQRTAFAPATARRHETTLKQPPLRGLHAVSRRTHRARRRRLLLPSMLLEIGPDRLDCRCPIEEERDDRVVAAAGLAVGLVAAPGAGRPPMRSCWDRIS